MVCYSRSRVARDGRSRKPRELLTDAKPTIEQIHAFRCEVRVGVLKETRKTLEVEARSGILVRYLSYENYWAMMESEETVTTQWHYSVVETVSAL